MFYFICGYCGKTATALSRNAKYRPKCKCKGGNGKTFMTSHPKKVYTDWKKNKRVCKKLNKSKEGAL